MSKLRTTYLSFYRRLNTYKTYSNGIQMIKNGQVLFEVILTYSSPSLYKNENRYSSNEELYNVTLLLSL